MMQSLILKSNENISHFILVESMKDIQSFKFYKVFYPNRTFFIIWWSGRSSPRLEALKPATHFDEQRYCRRGMRYFPQKSTNLMCSTRLSKNTPETDMKLMRTLPALCGGQIKVWIFKNSKRPSNPSNWGAGVRLGPTILFDSLFELHDWGIAVLGLISSW